jgi:hypothetical protein
MNTKEQAFLQSIKEKIKDFKINTDIKNLLNDNFAGQILEVQYSNGKIEEVDIGIEYELCRVSPSYFISNYAWIDFPGIGIIPFDLYYFQKQVLSRIESYQKIVIEKVRQCLTKENFVMTDKGYISIKDVKIGDKIETIVDGKSSFVLVKDSFYTGKRKVCTVETISGLKITCTLDHKVFTKRGWIEAGDLTVKDEIASMVRESQSFERIKKIVQKRKKRKVYDITTESSDFLANGLLVHNCGMSTLFSLYCFWRGNFHESESIDVVSLKQLKAQAFVDKMNATMNRIPVFLKTEIVKNNSQVIEWKNNSKIVSESQSENAGRSDSLSLLVLDEAAHYVSERMIRGIVAAAQPTLSRTGGQMVLLSTPNGTASSGAYYYEQVMQARMENDKDTFLVSIDWWEVPDFMLIPGPKKGFNKELKEYALKDYFNKPEIKKEAKKFFDPIAEKDYKNNPWLKKQYEDLGEILYKQEVLHNFIVSGSSVFNEDILDNVSNRIKDPVQKDKLGEASIQGLWIWKHPIPGHRYCIGIDISTGTGDDFTTIEVFDVDEYEQAAEYKGMMSTKMIGRFAKIIARYYNEAFVIIECNSIGEAVFNEVYYHDSDPYINVYKQRKTKNGVTRMTGWTTDVKTRKLITNEFIDWFSVDGLFSQLLVYSKRLYLEMTTWIWDGNKPIHAGGAHDDSIIAFSLVLYLRNESKKAGEGYLIMDDGQLIAYDGSKDKIEDENDDSFGIVMDENDEEDIFQKNYGVSKEDYEWIIK